MFDCELVCFYQVYLNIIGNNKISNLSLHNKLNLSQAPNKRKRRRNKEAGFEKKSVPQFCTSPLQNSPILHQRYLSSRVAIARKEVGETCTTERKHPNTILIYLIMLMVGTYII